jgi:hydroxymethylbilane synthase
MSPTRLVLATRRSALALAQARAFARDLGAHWPGLTVEELHVVTTGDKVTTVPLAEVGGKGLFTKEIEEALDRGDAHFAVHSFKDVPADVSPKFAIACVPRRADARDVVVTRSGAKLEELPSGARVGTSSLRRAMQLALLRPELTIVPLRGNVDTRLRKLDTTELDAIVLAAAGLARLGLSSRATEALDPTRVIPAPGQGALAIECRAGDDATRAALAPLSDPDTEIAVACERGVMHAVGGSCTVPFGAYAIREGGTLRVNAVLAGPAGAPPNRIERTISWPRTAAEAAEVGREIGKALLF